MAVKALAVLKSTVPAEVYDRVKLVLAGGYDERVQVSMRTVSIIVLSVCSQTIFCVSIFCVSMFTAAMSTAGEHRVL